MKILRLLRFAIEAIKVLRECDKKMAKLGPCWPVVYSHDLGKEYRIKDAVLTEAVAYDTARVLFRALICIADKHSLMKEGATK